MRWCWDGGHSAAIESPELEAEKAIADKKRITFTVARRSVTLSRRSFIVVCQQNVLYFYHQLPFFLLFFVV